MAWEELLGFIEEAREIEREDRASVPTSCPNDYTALVPGADGKMICPWDGLIWPDDASAWGEFPGSF